MEINYNQVSKEVGYVGYLPYPSMQEVDKLISDLSLNPTLTDFKTALSLYRFTPEAETDLEQRMIYMLQLGLSISKKGLFPEVEKQPVLASALNYILSLLP